MNTKLGIGTVAACALVLSLSLVACGGQEGPSGDSSTSTSPAAEPAQQADSGKESMTLLLDYSAGTGYEWVVDITPEGVVEQVSHETADQAQEGVSGGPLQDRIGVQAVGPGEAEVVCKLVRPWKEEEEPAEEQVFYLVVDDDLQITVNPYKSSYENEPEYGAADAS